MFLYMLIRGFRGSVSEKRKSEAERWPWGVDADRGGQAGWCSGEDGGEHDVQGERGNWEGRVGDGRGGIVTNLDGFVVLAGRRREGFRGTVGGAPGSGDSRKEEH